MNIFGQAGTSRIGLGVNDDSSAIITKSLAFAKQPDGDFVTDVADGLAYQTTTLLLANEEVVSPWIDSDGFSTIEVFASSDVLSAIQGLAIEYTDDTQALTPTVRGSKKYTFSQIDADRGFKLFFIRTALDGFRVRYLNDGINQTEFFLSVTLRKLTDNYVFNLGGALVTADFDTEVALGNISNYTEGTISGRNPEINTTTDPEDIWNGGGMYTGQPRNFTPETVQVFSSSVLDVNITGTGAWQVRFTGLRSRTSTFYETETVNLNGTTPVLSVGTWWRINDAKILTAGTGRKNAGTITIRSSTTTANVFTVMPIGLNETSPTAFTVPFGQKCLIKTIRAAITRLSGAAGSATIIFNARPDGGVYNAERIYECQTGARISEDDELVLDELTDIKMTVEQVSDNATVAEGSFRYILQQKD